MLVNEEGPYDSIIRLRSWLFLKDGIDPTLETLRGVFSCIMCMSVWVGAVLSFLPTKVSVPFALSAIAILVDRWGLPRAKPS